MRIKKVIYYIPYKFFKVIYYPIGRLEYFLRRQKHTWTIKYVEKIYYNRLPKKE